MPGLSWRSGRMAGAIADDLVQPFQIEPVAICAAGWCGSARCSTTILTRHAYPAPVAALLGEAIALAVDPGAAPSNTTASSRCRPRATGRCACWSPTSPPRARSAAMPSSTRTPGSAAREAAERQARRRRAAALGRRLSRLHRRSGRAHRALSGHRRAAGRRRWPNARIIISARASRSRRAQGRGRTRGADADGAAALARRRPDDQRLPREARPTPSRAGATSEDEAGAAP